MHWAGQTPAHSSQPMHFSIPSSYLFRMWRPWNRVGFGRLASGYSVVTRGPNRAWRSVTANPPHLPIGRLLPFREDLDARPAGSRPVRHAGNEHAEVDGDEPERHDGIDPEWPVLVLCHPVRGRHGQPPETGGDPDLPCDVHELVVAEAGQRGAEPDVAEQKQGDLEQEPEQPADDLGDERREGPGPAAEEQRHGEGRPGGHVPV